LHAWPHVDRRAHLLVIGDGPERANLERLTESLDLTARVTFAGAQRDMAPWYAAADCVLSTSGYDTFPNVLLEGMYLGHPIVVPEHDPPHAYSGFAEVVREHRCGLLYNRAAPAALAACLNRLAGDPREATELGAHALKAARRRYHWTHAAARILIHCGVAPAVPKTERPPATVQTAVEALP
jgi:glycosyltransferase involved in cell wall biosynthesis